MRSLKNPLILFVFVSLLATSCGTTPDGPDDAAVRDEVLADLQQIIVEAYTNLSTSTTALASAVETFTTTPSIATLSAAQQAWVTAYTDWQGASGFNFGPADGLFGTLLEEVGTFPPNINGIDDRKGIENYIAEGDNSLNNFDRDTRGFLTLEYLLFNGDSPSGIVEAFSTHEGAANRVAYLTAVMNHASTQVGDVADEWINGSAATDFVANNGISAGSSISLFFNEFSKSFESVKNFKVALPAGLRPGQTSSEPSRVEAYYSGTSLAMISAHMDALEGIWRGTLPNGTDGKGFDDYLTAVEGGPELVTATENQLAAIDVAINALPSGTPFSTLVETHPNEVNNLFLALQQHTRYFKSDMSSLLGIAITFNSGDGD